MNGPKVKTGPMDGKIRSRLKNGRWRAKRSDTGISRAIKSVSDNASSSGKIMMTIGSIALVGISLYLAPITTILLGSVILYFLLR